MMPRRFILMSALGSLVLTAAPGRAETATTADDPAVFIQDFGDRAIAVLTVPNISDRELSDRFRSLFTEGFDVPAVGRRVLGRYWSQAERDGLTDEYLSLFEDYVVQIYALRFRSYSGETFQAQGTRPAPGGFLIVESKVVPLQAPSIPVNWLLTHTEHSYKIHDVIIEGVSMVVTQRSEFASVIGQKGGKVSGLLDVLRAKTAELRSDRK